MIVDIKIESNRIEKNIFSKMKMLQCFENDIVVDFNDAISIVHCTLNIISNLT